MRYRDLTTGVVLEYDAVYECGLVLYTTHAIEMGAVLTHCVARTADAPMPRRVGRPPRRARSDRADRIRLDAVQLAAIAEFADHQFVVNASSSHQTAVVLQREHAHELNALACGLMRDGAPRREYVSPHTRAALGAYVRAYQDACMPSRRDELHAEPEATVPPDAPVTALRVVAS